MIQTSYYQKSGSLPNAVGISQSVPKWYKGELYKKLAPPWEIVKIENEATFRRLYHEMVLSHLNPVHVADDLEGALNPWREKETPGGAVGQSQKGRGLYGRCQSRKVFRAARQIQALQVPA